MIRMATRNDRTRIVELAREFHNTGAFDFPFDAAKIDSLFLDALEDDEKMVIVDDGSPVKGFLIASAVNSYVAKMRIGEEVVMWVSPDARSHDRLFDALLDEFERWAKRKGCRITQTYAQKRLRGEVLVKALEIRGYTLTQFTLIKVL